MGYSPQGHKESDMTERLQFLSFFLRPGYLISLLINTVLVLVQMW